MRLLSNRKGQIRVIEAFFASVLLLGCLTLIPAGVYSQDRNNNLVDKAKNALLTLDQDGLLASLASAHDWSGLSERLEASLPLNLWYNLTVFDSDLNALNDYPITNGGTVSENIVSVNYICASQNSTYTIYALQLQIAGVE